MSQELAILKRLQNGDILTPLQALNDPEIHSARLAARIENLRKQGHDIETLRMSSGKAVYAGYRLRTRYEGDQGLLRMAV